MWRRKYLSLFLLLCTSFMVPRAVFAIEIQIIDQYGEPVQDAVVSIPEGNIELVNSEPAIMDQIKRRFEPFVLAVEKGREIIFPNSDNIRHHVYSFSSAKSFQIKLYKGANKNPLLFDEDGIVVLGCNIHDAMIGYIFVSPWPNFKVTTSTGLFSFDQATKNIAVWHPWVLGLVKPLMFSVEEIAQNDFKIMLTITKPKPIKSFKSKFKKFYQN